MNGGEVPPATPGRCIDTKEIINEYLKNLFNEHVNMQRPLFRLHDSQKRLRYELY